MTRAPGSKARKGAGKKASAPAKRSGLSRVTAVLTRAAAPDDAEVSTLASDLGRMIDAARQNVAQAANAALTTLYWQLGHRVHTAILEGRRGEYGAQIVAAVGRQLEAQHGRGFGEKNLRRMVQFAEVFPDPEIVVSLIRQLSWTHFIALIPLRDPLQAATPAPRGLLLYGESDSSRMALSVSRSWIASSA